MSLTTRIVYGNFSAGGLVLIAEQHLARQLHPVMLVDGDDLDLELVADLAHILDLADILVVQLAYVTEPIAAGQDLDEGAEVLDRGHPALVDLADAHLLGQRLDLHAGCFGLVRFHV